MERVHHHGDVVFEFFDGGGLEPGEPVHRHDFDCVAPRFVPFGQPRLEHLLRAALDHVQQPGRSGAVADRGEVDDDGDVLVAAAGVPPVGSVRGAVTALLPFRFPGPPAEPAVRLSPQRALHEGCCPAMQVWLMGSTGSGSDSRGSGTG